MSPVFPTLHKGGFMDPVRYVFIKLPTESPMIKGILDSERSEFCLLSRNHHDDIICAAVERLNKGTLDRSTLVWAPSA
jgi:hypothetical protein